MPIIRRSNCVSLPIVVCPVVPVVMLESRVARCVHCVENVACRQHSPRPAEFVRIIETPEVEEIQIYTDGSKNENGVGAGIAIFDKGKIEKK